MKQKKYLDIQRLKPEIAAGFEAGDLITVTEKIDGANLCIRYDPETDTIRSFSRKRELDEINDLRGAWEWTRRLDTEKVRYVLGSNLCLFGEWLVKHTVPYPEEKYHTPYFFDVYDTETEQYLDQDAAQKIVAELGLEFVPVLYEGPFTSWEEIEQYVGQTRMGGQYGEGIVVKNITKLNNPNTRTPFYTKLVCEQFYETSAHRETSKVTDFEAMAEQERLQNLTESIVTRARVQKLLHKMVDEGIIPEHWDEHDMGTIIRNIGRETYYDCVKEESEIVAQVGDSFGRYANKAAMKIVKMILAGEE